MKRLCLLAVASLFLAGLSITAAAAPIAVTYGFSAGVGFAGWGSPSGSGANGMGGAQMIVVYASGSPLIGGSLGSPATIQHLQVNFTSPGTLLANPLSSIVVAGGVPGTLSVGGFWNFSGASAIAASALGPGVPSLSQTGNAFLVFNVLGPASIGLSGGGTQMFTGPGATGSWTLGGMVGTEISRAVVPEPVSGALLLGGFALLATFAVRSRVQGAPWMGACVTTGKTKTVRR